MGCGTSTRRISILSSNNVDSERSSGRQKPMSIQDEARSFRSKLGAIKMLTRNDVSYQSFLEYLQDKGKSEFLVCYRDMEEIKTLAEDQMISRTAALIWRYKSIFESVRVHGVRPDNMEYLIWECFGKLRQMDIANAPAELILKHLLIAQNEILARLVIPFESYLQSPNYKNWQERLIEIEKQRRSQQHSSSLVSNKASLSARLETCSANYPQILVVDDSTVTLKITGLTLERDGHFVDRASNGQIALEKMKSRPYDVVLIDCNMPVMDGFEAVRLFREHERSKKDELLLDEDDLSSISVSDDETESPTLKLAKSREREERKKSGKDAKQNPALISNDANTVTETSPEIELKPIAESKPLDSSLTGDQRLRKTLTAEHYHQLIIGMSTCIDEDTRSRALAAGMDYFLPKPFTLEKFIETIRSSRDYRKNNARKSEKSNPSSDAQSVASKNLNEMTVKTTTTTASTASTSHIYAQIGSNHNPISSFTSAIGQALSPKNQLKNRQDNSSNEQQRANASFEPNSNGTDEIPLPVLVASASAAPEQ